MQLFQVPEPEALAALRALKSVALANGEFTEAERALLGTAARLYGVAADLDALPSIGAKDLAGRFPAQEDRLQLIDACLLMALADEEATAEEWKVLHELGAAL